MSPHFAVAKRVAGDIIELRLISNYGEGHDEFFRGRARLNNPREIAALFDAACSKGLRLPTPQEEGWFKNEG